MWGPLFRAQFVFGVEGHSGIGRLDPDYNLIAEIFMAVWHSTILKILACFAVLQLIVNEIVKVAGNKDPFWIQHVIKEGVAVGTRYHPIFRVHVKLKWVGRHRKEEICEVKSGLGRL